MSQLTTDEILLLENLTYLTNESPLSDIQGQDGKTVGEWLNSIDVSKLDSSKDYGSYMTGSDWKGIIHAVHNDPTLSSMTIKETHVDTSDGGGGGLSAVFTNDTTGDAVVAFRGTASGEWKDDFVGGGKTDTTDGVSTKQQENALNWYKESYEKNGLDAYEVTVTGHSKGGNKAKYITILDDSVDHCVSFDGQGFSDEFINKYKSNIATRQDIIDNHNVDYDYVNILLNDVGNKTYYKGNDLGDGGFLENHCPNTFFDMKEDGSYTMNVSPNGQGKEMQELDEFLNSCLRSVDADKKAEMLDFLGTMVEGGFNSKDATYFKEVFFDEDYKDEAAYIIAYLIKYEQANPEFLESIDSILENFGMGDIVKYVNVADTILDWKYFDQLYDALNSGINKLASNNWLINKLLDYINEKTNLNLTKEELLELLSVLSLINLYMDEIDVKADSGKDISVKSDSDSSEHSNSLTKILDKINTLSEIIHANSLYPTNVTVYPDKMNSVSQNLQGLSRSLQSLMDEMDSIQAALNQSMSARVSLNYSKDLLANEKKAVEDMAETLQTIQAKYAACEKSITKM